MARTSNKNMDKGNKRDRNFRQRHRNKHAGTKPVWQMLVLVVGILGLSYLGLLSVDALNSYRHADLDVPVILPVEEIEVTGELAFVDKDSVREIIEQHMTGGYFTLNLEDLRGLLLEQPWIENASLRRQWPAKLFVHVTEQTPVAYWNGKAYINDKGDVFMPKKLEQSLQLPAFNGPEGQHEAVWKFMNRLHREMALLEYEVAGLNLDSRRAWQLDLVSDIDGKGLRVKIGRFDTEKRLQRLVNILPVLASEQSPFNERIELVDLRYPNGFAVKKQAVSAGVEADYSQQGMQSQKTMITGQGGHQQHRPGSTLSRGKA